MNLKDFKENKVVIRILDRIRDGYYFEDGGMIDDWIMSDLVDYNAEMSKEWENDMTDKLKELERQLSEGVGTLTFREGQAIFFDYVHEVLRIMRDYANRFER